MRKMKIKKTMFTLIMLFMSALSGMVALANASDGEYGIVIEGYDWGPAVSKVILSMDEPVSAADWQNYHVRVHRSSECSVIPDNQKVGSRNVIGGYTSDVSGNRVAEGTHLTLVLAVAPNQPIGSPIQYSFAEGCSGNYWIDYDMVISNSASGRIWSREVKRIMPIIDRFDLSGRYSNEAGIRMSYASYSPASTEEKKPLIIWLHGGGEGGTDPSIPLVANRAANYASDEIQALFGGAHVLVPQSPTRWMDSGEGTTSGQVDDIYFEALKELIDDFIAANNGVDSDRIYVGGCSNGGYMALKLVIEYPDFFAAAFPSALAYRAAYLTEAQVDRIKGVPMWFIHSRDDNVTVPDETVVPVYSMLKNAGAPVHFTYYDHVVDITGFFGGDGYHHPGHWSWIYSHANTAMHDYDVNVVEIEGRPATIMEWMAAQSR